MKTEDDINSLADFLRIKEKNFYTSNLNPQAWIYRGVKKFEYSLIPSIGRLIDDNPKVFPNKKKLFKFEKSAFTEFQISVYSKYRTFNPIMLLAVAQHHGLKTRFLDWTLSPLTALFFAVEDESELDEDAGFYALQPPADFNKLDDEEWKNPFDIKYDYHFLFLPDLTERIKAQKGVFQLFQDPTKEVTNDKIPYSKYKIPKDCKKQIKRELFELGISKYTICPDLEGLTNHINYYKFNS